MTQEQLRETGVLVEPHGVLASAEILLSLHTLRRVPPKAYPTHRGWFLFLVDVQAQSLFLKCPLVPDGFWHLVRL